MKRMLAVVLGAVSFVGAGAQGPRTPADCLAEIASLRAQRGAPKNADAARQIGAEVKQRGTACAAKLDTSQPKPADYAVFATLYITIGDTVQAIGWVERGLSSLLLTSAQRGDVLLTGIRVSMAGVGAVPDTLKLSEAYMRQLDALPDSLAQLKILGHMRLLGHYDYADVDALLRQHAEAILDIARRTGDTTSTVLTAYTSLARALSDFGHPDSALAVLDAAQAALSSTFPVDRIEKAFGDSRKLYRLVGQRAPPIRGDYWLNSAADQREVRFDEGQVVLIQFTAHWCIPCRNSYPSIKRLAKHFEGGHFETVFETELYGNFDGKRVDQPVELADDRAYYTEHWGMPFKIAVNRPAVAGAESNEDRYAVLGIPQTVVVDKRGIIRAIVSGWDVGNEARLTKLIEQLLGEP